MRPHQVLFGALIVLIVGCTPGEAFDESAWASEHEAWRQQRLERLTSETGWLSLAGLYWLTPGTHRAGSAGGNAVRLPTGTADDVIGEFTLDDNGVTFTVAPDVTVERDGERIEHIRMESDREKATTVLSHRRLSWYVVERSGRFGIRLRDHDNPAIARFKGIDTFPADSRWRVHAQFVAYDEPRKGRVPTVIDWWDYEPEIPGILRFEIDETTYELEPAASGDSFFIIFADRTSGRDTYGAGRFVYAEIAGPGGDTVIDFNKAYNPPCVFNEYATCPVAPPRNRLDVAITAGEKYDPGLYPDG